MEIKYTAKKATKNAYGLTLLTQKVISLVSLFVLFMSPLAPLFASEISETAGAEEVHEVLDSEENKQITEETNIGEATPIAETENVHEEVGEDENPADSDGESTAHPEVDTEALSETNPEQEIEVLNVDNSTTTNQIVESSSTRSLPVAEDGENTTGTSSQNVPLPESTTTVETTVLIDDEEAATTTPTDTVLVVEEAEDLIITENIATTTVVQYVETVDASKISFDKKDCVRVGDGTFYCAESEETPLVHNVDRVFSAVDEDGDKEIYIERSGELTQVTRNTEDDDAPYFDTLSNTIVWHKLIEGRYQIMEFDLGTEEETQITFDRYNNMQPNRFDTALVWQGWVGDDWEVFLLNDEELTMLTDNTTHDIVPSINGTHIVWQSFEDGAWRMKLYDIRTKHIETIGDGEGSSIQNPRFVLVYDTKLETGDVETKGYDLVSGEIVPLSATPKPIPNEIPDPDQTGEERALVTSPAQTKTKIEEDDSDGNSLDTDEPPLDDQVVEGDLVIPPLSVEETVPLPIASTTDSIHEDIVLPPLELENSTSTGHIEDVVVPPFIETVVVIDPQEAIAN